MNFYKSVLGGEFTIIGRFKGVPGGEKMSPEDQQKLMHISLTLPNGGVIMATDILEFMEQKLVEGNILLTRLRRTKIISILVL